MPQQIDENNRTLGPKWLTKDYLQDKLQKRYNKLDLIITDIKNQPASSKGGNYISEMFGIKIFYRVGSSIETEETKESIIVKNTVSGDNIKYKIMNEYGVFKREMIMYEQILPRIQTLLDTISNDSDAQMYPKTIHVDYDHDSIIFEDLKEKGFTMADRLERLDMDHARLALNKLAKFHAAAAVLKEKSPELFAQNFDRGIFNRHTEGVKPAIIGVLNAMRDYIETQTELKKKYYEKMCALNNRIMEYCERAFDVNPNHFMTLIHGDFWHMNMMFKYTTTNDSKNKKPIDVIPLDFQFSAWASPAVDLHYFFNTSLCEELRLHKQLNLLQYYHNILVNNLKELKFRGTIPSLFEFRMQWEMRSFVALFSALIFQPIMICPDTDDADFMNLISEEESGRRFKKTLYKNVVVQKNIAQLLPIFDEMGLLDDLDSFRA